MKLSHTIREAATADAGRLVGLINSAFAVERFFTTVDRTTPERVRALLSKGVMLVVDDGAEALAGSVYVEVRGVRAYVGLLAVDPSRQRQGLGRTLMTAAERLARARGCLAVDITVVNLRLELPPFYRGLGYVETGTAPFDRDEPVPPGCHFIVMSKDL